MKTPPTKRPRTDTVRPGTPVLIGNDIAAVVTANTIRQDGTGKLYVSAVEVTWWVADERYCIDVEPWQVTPVSDANKERIGF